MFSRAEITRSELDARSERTLRREQIEVAWCGKIADDERRRLASEYAGLRHISIENARRRLNRQAQEWRNARADGLIG